MRRSAELIRRGMSMYAWPTEPGMTSALERLRDQVRQAQAAVGPEGQQKGAGADGKDPQLARALDQLERTRQRMQDMADSRQRGQGRQGQQPGQQPGGQQRQMEQLSRGSQPGSQQGQQSGQQGQPGQQQGQQQGQQGQPGQQQAQQGQPSGQPGNSRGGQNGGDQPGSYDPNRRDAAGEYGYAGLPHNGWVPDQVARDAQRDLSALRMQLRDRPELAGQVQDLLQQLQHMAAFQNPQELSDRLSREILPEMERIELQLRRELGEGGSQVRNSSSEPVPAGYADAVAEYFKRLSKGK
jgi:hypothetical protein